MVDLEEEKGPILLRVSSVPCFDFVDENGERRRVTAIIAPIRIIKSGNGWKIAWACSRALACKEKTCRYSKAFRCNTGE
mgnify:CR=1 FL=1